MGVGRGQKEGGAKIEGQGGIEGRKEGRKEGREGGREDRDRLK